MSEPLALAILRQLAAHQGLLSQVRLEVPGYTEAQINEALEAMNGMGFIRALIEPSSMPGERPIYRVIVQAIMPSGYRFLTERGS